MSREVYVTGLGLVTPAGVGVERSWKGLLAGERYVRLREGDGLAGGDPWPAAEVGDFAAPEGTGDLDRVCQFALAAADEAVHSAGFDKVPAERTVVCVGTSKGGILSFADSAPLLTRNRLQPFARQNPGIWAARLTSIPPDAPARLIARRLGTAGGIHATVAACSTGSLAVIRGVHLIQDGDAEVVVCGSSDASIHPLWFAAFERMGVLAKSHPALGPAWACAPFDRRRQGFALGEGAGILVLESSESVRRRGIRPIARMAGVARATDPEGLTQLSPGGESLIRAIREACRQAGLGPQDLGSVHAHGTGTALNDLIEARAIGAAVGGRGASLPVVSVKGAVGHLLGGAGAVEIAFAALACQHGISPGTVTLSEPDPALGDLTFPARAFCTAGGAVLKLSLGFGGHVAAVVVARA